jgi:hypothetical protein
MEKAPSWNDNIALVPSICDIIEKFFKKNRFSLEDEKKLQIEIELRMLLYEIRFHREKQLDKANIIDFLVFDKVGVEIKLKGSKVAIYRQCERYCNFDQIKALFLITNKSMTLPPQINGRSCYVLNLSEAWL